MGTAAAVDEEAEEEVEAIETAVEKDGTEEDEAA